ncbi:hypothetical protein KEM56_003506, partial [Ascosphaera pollenicola]
MTATPSSEALSALKYIPLSYSHADSENSARKLVLALFPEWESSEGEIEFVRFTDGITNTLLKAIKRTPGSSAEDLDHNAVLMRAYGNHTEILIDRERETRSHALLASRGLAPPLLARFENGLLYRFLRGRVAQPLDLTKPPIYRGVARRLAQWHAALPISAVSRYECWSHEDVSTSAAPEEGEAQNISVEDQITPVTPRHAGLNIWAVIQKWILALPVATKEQRERRKLLQREFEGIVRELDNGEGLGDGGLVFSHCDLLSANVIIEPSTDPTIPSPTAGATTSNAEAETVSFIDYEYATPSPAAFDIANHFAEWGGYDCDYNMLPTRSVRREFLREYVNSFLFWDAASAGKQITAAAAEEIAEELFRAVDKFRGIPGFYWGVWALIQAEISKIDFDYASYAE